MDLHGLSARAFRARLKDELPKWRDEGLIDDDVAERLAHRYELEEPGAQIATIAMYVLGSLLIGGGVISFVAWNWEHLPDAIKLLVLAAFMLGAHGAGFYLRDVSKTSPRFGHALLFLGSLMFGANIGLVAQIFHISSTWYHGWGAWAAGALVAAWAYRSLPTAVIALVTSAVFLFPLIEHEHTWGGALAMLFAAVFTWIAWVHKSRGLFVLTLVSAVGLLVLTALESVGDEGVAMCVVILSCAAFFLALPSVLERTSRAVFCSWSTGLGMVGLVGVSIFASFHDVARELRMSRIDADPSWVFAVAPLLLAALVILARTVSDFWTHPIRTTGALATFLLMFAMFLPAHGYAVAAAANLGLMALSVFSIRSSLETLRRGPFWLGAMLAVVLIMCRFLEFDTGLLVKAAVFIATGAIVILVGVRFERALGSGDKHAAT